MRDPRAGERGANEGGGGALGARSAAVSAAAAAAAAAPVSAAIAAAAASSAASPAAASSSLDERNAAESRLSVFAACDAPARTSSNRTPLRRECDTTARAAATSRSDALAGELSEGLPAPSTARSHIPNAYSSSCSKSAEARCASPRGSSPAEASNAARSAVPARRAANRAAPSCVDASPGGGVTFSAARSASAARRAARSTERVEMFPSSTSSSSRSGKPDPVPVAAAASI